MHGVQSIDRTIAIVRAVAQAHKEGARSLDVALSIGVSKSTTHRILQALTRAGWLEQSGQTGRFHLGLELCTLGAIAAPRHELVDLGQRAASRLAERVGDTVYFQVRVGFESICVARREGSFPVKILTLDVGTRRPLGVSAGNIAMLGSLPDGEAERAIEINLEEIAHYAKLDTESLRQLVHAARTQGYAFIDSLFIPGMSAVGVPILGPDGLPIASLSVAAMSSRLQGERRANITAWLQTEAREVETGLLRPTDYVPEAPRRRPAGKSIHNRQAPASRQTALPQEETNE